jgi:L-threonylcarbamoyladenylate synthase
VISLAQQAAEVLRAGGLVIVPTDTVYGVACDPENLQAVARLYQAKGRGEEKPLQLLLASPDWAGAVCRDLTPEADRLAGVFFPGGITLVVRRADSVRPEVVAGGDTVGLRVPDHRECLEVVRAFGRPVAASSANRSGGPSPRTAQEAVDQLGDFIDLVVDAGPCPIGTDSTVIDATVSPVRILREGAVPRAEIEGALKAIVPAPPDAR